MAKVYCRSVLDGLSDWWNDVELWVIQLPFAAQFALVMAVLLPLCVVVAWAIDRVVDYASARFGTSRDERPLGSRANPDPGS
ncbi:hypothetical protein SAMN05192558_103378 [Actinokineospora alba]|uniref:Uncharacterized protein n=1 Tax=Actinokineospora alba TaxID=504798 RepID=A0A1H0K891_9PSEU|nr:hypothetical protein C8E96_3564 [Actinokineospora alba]SDH90587.1 hypothetical protein SAMN05421871_102671 [Actinokineospora alba]SDO52107.1 hypothetical protein SAMN05192558_103378 [Actinokineospora alba]